MAFIHKFLTSQDVSPFSRNNKFEVLDNLEGLINHEDLEKEYENETVEPKSRSTFLKNNIDPSPKYLETKSST